MRRRPSLSLADLQASLQTAILSGDLRPVMPLIRQGAQAPRETLLGVYTSAYTLRLVGILKADFPATAAYMGDDAFARAARAYVAANPSPHRSARWVGDRFAAHLASSEDGAAHPECAALAALEWALGLAFDAPDAPPLALADLLSVPPDSWGALVFQPHPSASHLTQTTNAFEIWSALKDETAPPPARSHDEPAPYLVWRRDGTPAIRPLTAEESMLWCEAARGTPFAALCELAAVFDDPQTAAARVAATVRGWLDTGALAA